MAKNGGNIGKGAKIGIAIALAMACCIPAVASETTTGEFVILEDPADFSDTPPLDGLDILKWTVSEPDGENLVFTITMLGDFSALEDPILDDRDYGFMIVRFIIDNTPYDKVIYPEHDGNGIVAVSSNIITLQYPYVTLSGIHLGSVLKDSYIVTRFQGTIGDLAPGGSTTTGDTNALNPGNPIFPPTEYGNEYTITMGPAIKIEADALAKKVKLNDEVEFSVGFTNTGPDNATISLRAVSSKKGWQA
ncbi:MAG: hypothetical protein OIN87_13620, partial [Candidatus Methanoperedens sp.]|nr:hypothetical protein [Candidatus Methanoperedens sp.]